MFDRRKEKLAPLPTFLRRAAFSLLLALGVLCVALGIGAVGYHAFARLPWVDAVENASMILTGMGPIATMPSKGAKLFASGYALFSGIVFLSSIGLVLAPPFHRLLHKFHLDDTAEQEPATRSDSTPRGPRK